MAISIVPISFDVVDLKSLNVKLNPNIRIIKKIAGEIAFCLKNPTAGINIDEIARIVKVTSGAEPIANNPAHGASAEAYAILPQGKPPKGK